jgi:hypothetical protein
VLFALACACRRFGCNAAETLALLAAYNARRCRPPLALPELEAIEASSARYQPHT